MGVWEKALDGWEKGRQFVDKLTDAKDFAEGAKGAYQAGKDASSRSATLPLILTAQQAYDAMKLRHGAKYPRQSVSEMTQSEIEAVQWQLETRKNR